MRKSTKSATRYPQQAIKNVLQYPTAIEYIIYD